MNKPPAFHWMFRQLEARRFRYGAAPGRDFGSGWRRPGFGGLRCGLHRIYVTGRAGDLCVIDRDSKGAIMTLDKIPLHYGAHTLAVDPVSHRLYAAYASLVIAPRIAVFSPLAP